MERPHGHEAEGGQEERAAVCQPSAGIRRGHKATDQTKQHKKVWAALLFLFCILLLVMVVS